MKPNQRAKSSLEVTKLFYLKKNLGGVLITFDVFYLTFEEFVNLKSP